MAPMAPSLENLISGGQGPCRGQWQRPRISVMVPVPYLDLGPLFRKKHMERMALSCGAYLSAYRYIKYTHSIRR